MLCTGLKKNIFKKGEDMRKIKNIDDINTMREVIKESGFAIDSRWVKNAGILRENGKYKLSSLNGNGTFEIMEYMDRYIVINEKGEKRECLM